MAATCSNRWDFSHSVRTALGGPLRAVDIEVLQVNLGYRCNLSCKHCHLEGGGTRTNEMSYDDCHAVLRVLEGQRISTLDLTGGAPELNANFPHMVRTAREMGTHVIARTNLAVFFEPGQEGLAQLYADNRVEVIASLPYYTAAEVDRVRGQGVFLKCMEAIKQLNSLGYGRGDKHRTLNLVYNPRGAFFSPPQQQLQEEFRQELSSRHGVSFDSLYTFTNMPLGRFRAFLQRSGQLASYEKKLRDAFNPATLEGVMCRRLLSVGPEGRLYDCDFNQAAGLALQDGLPSEISSFDYHALANRDIAISDHCYGCTAGAGST